MSNDKHTRKIAVIGNGLVSVETERSELATLRAEKAELIEALRGIVNAIQHGLELEDIVNAKFIATQTLAKLETK